LCAAIAPLPSSKRGKEDSSQTQFFALPGCSQMI
jgi:hypothetical protein